MQQLYDWQIDTSKDILFTCSGHSEELKSFLKDDYNFESCLRLLSLSDQLKVRNVKHKRHMALISRLFLKFIINLVICKATLEPDVELWRELEFGYSEHGKPILPSKSFVFNNSNSNEMSSVAILFNSRAIGVDLSHEEQQSISPIDFIDQFKDMFSDGELLQLNAIENQEERYIKFNQLWTLKEAFTKYLGCGLNLEISSFSFEMSSLPEARKPVSDSNIITHRDASWTKSDIDASEVPTSLLKDLGYDIHCYSTTLRTSDKLPVLASVISNSPTNPIIVEIDLFQILKNEIV